MLNVLFEIQGIFWCQCFCVIYFCHWQVQNAISIEEIRAYSEGTDILAHVGYTTPLFRITQKRKICQSIHEYYCVNRIKQELDQFKEGLKSYGLLDAVQKHQELFKQLFHANSKSYLTAGKPSEMYIIAAKFSNYLILLEIPSFYKIQIAQYNSSGMSLQLCVH